MGRDKSRLHPRVRELCAEFERRCREAGLNVLVTETFRTAAEQEEAILEDCKPVNERNKDTVAEAAYRLTEILLLLNDDKKAVAAAEIAWTNGRKEWEPAVVNRLNDLFRSGVATSNVLPPPTKRATTASIVLFPLNVLPDMLGEAVCTSCQQGKRSLSWFQSSKPLWGLSVIVAVPIGFAGGMIGGVQEAWRGYPFWNTRSIRMMKGQEYPSNATINEW